MSRLQTGLTGILARHITVAVIATTGISPAVAAQSFARIDSIVDSGIRRGIYPGAALIIGRSSGVLYQRGYGRHEWKKGPAISPDTTRWDLASLTKVVGTTAAVLRLVDQRKIALDTPVVRYLPRFVGSGKERVTVRMLLNHTSGLRSYLPFYQLTRSRDSAITLLYAERLRRPAGAAAEYSDLNFILLGLLVERIAGEPLDRFVTQAVLRPAGMIHSTYRPADSLRRWITPTGRWRGTAICCEVNDQNALRLGGAAGHAGLFATAGDVARYARLWMNGGILDGQRVLDSLTVRAALTTSITAGDRLLGWEQPDPKKRDDSAYGSRTSLRTYGHTGWTGTLLWIDPTRDLFVVFLTNRSYDPKVRNSIRMLRGIRAALADEIVEEVAGRSH
jgi:CubicO group peptidase (beta-lactamase class C family)